MGFSALDGLMMGTRTGALDPGAVLYLMEIEALTGASGRVLYHESGLLGVSGISAEPRVIVGHENDAGETGSERAWHWPFTCAASCARSGPWSPCWAAWTCWCSRRVSVNTMRSFASASVRRWAFGHCPGCRCQRRHAAKISSDHSQGHRGGRAHQRRVDSRQPRTVLPGQGEGAMTIDAFHGFTLAIVLLFVGKGLVARWGILRRYSIPESLVGGLACALVVFALYYGAGIVVSFDLEARDALLLYFFAAIGLGTDARTLRHGGRPLLILSGLAIGFMVLQNPGRDGDGTRLRPGSARRADGGIDFLTEAWAPPWPGPITSFKNLGIAQAQELGLAANMIGLIAACTIGGPIASLLMRRHRLQAGDSALEIGTLHRDEQHARLDYYGVLLALLWLNLALMLGYGISALVARTPSRCPPLWAACWPGFSCAWWPTG